MGWGYAGCLPLDPFRGTYRYKLRFYPHCFVIYQQLNEKGEAVGIGKFSHLLGTYVAVFMTNKSSSQGT